MPLVYELWEGEISDTCCHLVVTWVSREAPINRASCRECIEVISIDGNSSWHVHTISKTGGTTFTCCSADLLPLYGEGTFHWIISLEFMVSLCWLWGRGDITFSSVYNINLYSLLGITLKSIVLLLNSCTKMSDVLLTTLPLAFINECEWVSIELRESGCVTVVYYNEENTTVCVQAAEGWMKRCQLWTSLIRLRNIAMSVHACHHRNHHFPTV